MPTSWGEGVGALLTYACDRPGSGTGIGLIGAIRTVLYPVTLPVVRVTLLLGGAEKCALITDRTVWCNRWCCQTKS